LEKSFRRENTECIYVSWVRSFGVFDYKGGGGVEREGVRGGGGGGRGKGRQG